MDTVIIDAKLTEDGKIEIELPEGWQAGDIRVEIPIEPTWTDEEMLKPDPKPASEIVTGGWEDMGIEDSVAFVEEMRRKRREKNQW
jgi:hypothetical protein